MGLYDSMQIQVNFIKLYACYASRDLIFVPIYFSMPKIINKDCSSHFGYKAKAKAQVLNQMKFNSNLYA